MKKYTALFDMDETIVSIKTLYSFLRYYLNFKKLDNRFIQVSNHLNTLSSISRELANVEYYRTFAGESVSLLCDLGQKWFLEENIKEYYIGKVLDEINRHKSLGADVVLVSGGFMPCIKPIIQDIGIKESICSILEIINGVYTGNLLWQSLGKNKALSIKNYANEKGIMLKDCFAYSDHISDLPMLELVGNPCVISGFDERIVEHAKRNNWMIITPTTRISKLTCVNDFSQGGNLSSDI